MRPGNKTSISEFFFKFPIKQEQQLFIFGLFLGMYLVSVVGNFLIMLAIGADSHLHTPMYFFLSNLSFTDLCLVSTTVPKLLVSILTNSEAISYSACLTQMYFFSVFACMDNFLLTVMAYDRFVAICHPLRYATIMSPKLCGLLVLLSWIISFLDCLIQSLMAMQLSFCKDHDLSFFFCDLPQVLKLSCTEALINNILVYFTTGLLGVLPFMGILFSYTKICYSIVRVSSPGGKYKAFSTCGSHLCVVTLFYGTVFGMYLSSSTTHSWKSTVASVMYSVITPMLNPFIYSLRNKDIKGALKRLISRPTFSQ
ncbi:olfactory receptor 7C1-like [Notamacropus eugenii]|uniref:olfactory receptor 7C1-like n=1 Tax=Notamacropus eugenii TaxID=9315 RepID=UPI003B66B4ED